MKYFTGNRFIKPIYTLLRAKFFYAYIIRLILESYLAIGFTGFV